MNDQKQPLVDKETRGDNSPSFWAKMEVHEKLGAYIGIVALVAVFYLWGRVDGIDVNIEEKINARIAVAVAPTNELARTATQNAKLAEDRTNKIVAQLEARGLVKMENH